MELWERALDAARKAGAGYADIRVIREQRESVQTKNGAVEAVSSDQSGGFGIRVLVGGHWGFASSLSYEPAEVERVAAEAATIARASALAGPPSPVSLEALEPLRAEYRTPVSEDPFAVKLEERIGLLLDADARMRAAGGVRLAQGQVAMSREEQLFANTEGRVIEQSFVECGAGITATAVGAGEMQRRSYPASFGGNVAQAGYEFVRGLDLAAHAEQCAKEAAQLLAAPQCPSGQMDIILESSQLGLQIHESCGHPVELDRALGYEASYAGTSFLTPDKLGKFQYGSEHVNIVGDATAPGGLGTYAYDDEGVPGRRFPIIDRGRFVNYLTSRETAAMLGQASNGAMRADGWNRLPIIRMTNINLLPGDWGLDELIRDTGKGLLLLTNKSWSIDDRRLNFQFGTEAAYEIADGSLGRLYKNPTYTGITPEFWGSCDAVCSPAHWTLWGLPNCGKGEPPQVAHVGHGASPARFRAVRVGVGKW